MCVFPEFSDGNGANRECKSDGFYNPFISVPWTVCARICLYLLPAEPHLTCVQADEIFCQEAHEPQQYYLCPGVEIFLSPLPATA